MIQQDRETTGKIGANFTLAVGTKWTSEAISQRKISWVTITPWLLRTRDTHAVFVLTPPIALALLRRGSGKRDYPGSAYKNGK